MHANGASIKSLRWMPQGVVVNQPKPTVTYLETHLGVAQPPLDQPVAANPIVQRQAANELPANECQRGYP